MFVLLRLKLEAHHEMLHLTVLTGSSAAAAFQLRWKVAYNVLAHA